MLKKMILILSAIAAIPSLASAQMNGRQASLAIKKAMIARVDSYKKWHTKLGGKSGQTVRPFEANDMHSLYLNGSMGHVTVGHNVTGTINTKTGKVTVKTNWLPK